MRPRTVAEVVGQRRILQAGGPIARLLEPGPEGASAGRVSLILWGPPGTGKTTLATLAAAASGDQFVELSAVTAGVKDVRGVIEQAKRDLEFGGRGTVLFIDEVHRFSKTQQDALLPAVENGWVRLIAATTENPSFAVIPPLVSRSLLVPLTPLDDVDIGELVDRAVSDPRGIGGAVSLAPAARDQLIRLAGGDARRALTVLEAAAAGAGAGTGSSSADGAAEVEVGLDDIERAATVAAARYDRGGGQHYDIASALIKSVRGSDVDAALHYLARMVDAGEDPRFIARRLVILASEDIGMADPSALQTAVAAMQAVSFIGMPEARITLAHAVVHLSLAPKSNRAYLAIEAALVDVREGEIGAVPSELRDASTSSARRGYDAGKGYRYPHDEPSGIVPFHYAPAEIGDPVYYRPTGHGAEARWAEMAERIRRGLGRESGSESAGE